MMKKKRYQPHRKRYIVCKSSGLQGRLDAMQMNFTQKLDGQISKKRSHLYYCYKEGSFISMCVKIKKCVCVCVGRGV